MSQRSEISAEEYRQRFAGRTPGKLNATRIEVDGIQFASMAEAARWFDLVRLENGGQIRNLFRQPRYALHVHGVELGEYVADASYWDVERDCLVVEDVKSPLSRTPIYRWKKRHMKAEYGIDITEVEA